MNRRTTATLAAAVAPLLWLASAAHAQVHDEAHLLSPDAVTSANSAIQQMQQAHNKGLVYETIPKVSDENMAAAKADQAAYFKASTTNRMEKLQVNGVYVLVCMDPKYVEVRGGRETMARGDFTAADIARLSTQLKADLRGGNNDQALSDAVDTVNRAYGANITGSAPAAAAGRSAAPAPSYSSSTPAPTPTPAASSGGMGMLGKFGLGGLLCAVVGVVIIFSLIKSAFGRRGGGYGGGVMNQGGTYPTGGPVGGPGYGGGTNMGGYGGVPQSRGSGFGGGLLGGLLGGAVGGAAVDHFEHRGDAAPSAGGGALGGGDAGGGSFGGGGGGFDSGPSDAGQASDVTGGGDFGGGGGGGDAGGGGGGDAGGGSF